MSDALTDLFESESVSALLSAVDSVGLSRELGGDDGDHLHATRRLRVAAYTAWAEALGQSTLHDLLRTPSEDAERSSREGSAERAFLCWSGYLEALRQENREVMPDDLLFIAAAALLARQTVDLRALLRHADLSEEDVDSSRGPWPATVRQDVTRVLLLLARQSDHSDIREGKEIIDRLVESQGEFESEWIADAPNERRSALLLLGYYHVGQAAARTSEFLLSGSVEQDGRQVPDFAPELRRLLLRAEEYLELSGDIDSQLWLRAGGVILWKLREDSIWASGRGISRRIDELLEELVSEARERPIFSLLPSQQDALRDSLLDPARIAVVLQMPTSAGKTLLAEFAIVQAIEAYGRETKVAYVVPTRALATQIQRTLARDLGPLGVEVTGAGSAFEEDPFELTLLAESTGVVVVTPEKLDLLLRSHSDWFDGLRLIVVDEAHHLSESERGVRLELLLANVRRERPEVRLLLLTPFVENASQLATWLGGPRGLPIEVRWRPSRLILGLANIAGSGRSRALTIRWQEPYGRLPSPSDTRIPVSVPAKEIQSRRRKLTYLSEHFLPLGTVLGLFTGSRVDAEDAAEEVAAERRPLELSRESAGLRVAVALARSEYGAESLLARCLERGVAYHHSSLSPLLRYLVEDQVSARSVSFIAATTTLAQGMNFPVATVLVQSVKKPRNRGSLTPSEFWNIAGRAGRAGLVDRGLVVFVDEGLSADFERYATELSGFVTSALLHVLARHGDTVSFRDSYVREESLRPFLQYLAHAAATLSPARAMANLEELLEASLANAQVANALDARKLRRWARAYLEELAAKNAGMLTATDASGLTSFSFDELFGKIGRDPVLMQGPGAVLARGQNGVAHLVEALRWLPELNLAIGLGPGRMSVEAVADAVTRWISGQSIPDVSGLFPGDTPHERTREAARYLHGTVSQTLSWGAHAYLRGWSMLSDDDAAVEERLLPSFIQFGVNSPEAVVASLLGVPRQLAEATGEVYRERNAPLTPERADHFRQFLTSADTSDWSDIVDRSTLAGIGGLPSDVRSVWREMQGLTE